MKEFFTLKEAAEHVGRTDRTIRAWVASGDLIAIRGLVHRHNLEDVEAKKRRAQVLPLARSSDSG